MGLMQRGGKTMSRTFGRKYHGIEVVVDKTDELINGQS